MAKPKMANKQMYFNKETSKNNVLALIYTVIMQFTRKIKIIVNKN